jgi:hypothetical protein
MVTTAVGIQAKFAVDVFGITRPAFRPRVSVASSRFDSPSTTSQVLMPVVEFRKKAAAKAEKDHKMKEKAKDMAKGKKASLPVAGLSKPSKLLSRTSLLFSALCHLRLTRQPFPKAHEVPPRGGDESIKDLLEQWEGAMREVGVQLNELSGKVLEINEFQASIQNMMRKAM